jgi:hypothetical protein
MQIEKKLIACSILAIAIGIATVVPLAFFMNVKAETYDEPWFNVEVPYAYFKANATDNFYQSTTSIVIQPTINHDALSHQTDARIEYFEFTIYSDTIQLSNATYTLAINSSAVEDPTSLFEFSRENWFNSSAFGAGCYVTNLTEPLHLMGTGSSVSYGFEDSSWINKNFGAILSTMENAQTIYLDVRRLGYVTFDGNNIVVTLASNQVIQHLEMTKTGDAFTFGDPASVRDQFYSLPEPQY